MSLSFTQGKLQDHERSAILHFVQQQIRENAKSVIRNVVTSMLEAEVTTKLGREKGKKREANNSCPREIDWQCRHCGCNNAHFFIRDGHYQRDGPHRLGNDSPSAGAHARMPEYGARRRLPFCPREEKYQRFWMDLTPRRPLEQWMWTRVCVTSVIAGVRPWAIQSGCARTLEQINQLEPLV